MLPRAATCIELKMSVDEALKYIISMGVVAPAAGRARHGANCRSRATSTLQALPRRAARLCRDRTDPMICT